MPNQAAEGAAIVFDVEFTAWDNSMATGWRMPGQFKEIIQIGAVRVDSAFRVTDRFSQLIRPGINYVLTPYLEAVTGISNADLDAHAVSFPEGWRGFRTFCGDLPLIAYGRDDLVAEQNLRLHRMPAHLPHYINIVSWVRQQGVAVDIRNGHGCDIGPGVGVPFEGQPHNALCDAASLAAGIAALMDQGAASPLANTCPPEPLCPRDTMAPWCAWQTPDEADGIARALKLTPHPEGGSYREIFRDAPGPDGRARSTGIYFLLRAGECSARHRIDAAEVWHWYRGAPLELIIEDADGTPCRHVLGPMVEAGEAPQIVVPPHCWQSARSLGPYTLTGCTVAPGFDFSYFEMG